jgi:hypothetical protein
VSARRPRFGPRLALAAWLALAAALAAALAVALAVGVRAWRAGRDGARKAVAPEARSATPAALALWIVGDSVKVRPGQDLGRSHPPGTPVRLRGARGETVAFQVVMAAEAGSPAVDVEVGDLSGPGGTIPRQGLSAFLESHMYCPAVDARVVALPAGEYPDPLVPLWEAGPGTRPVAAPFALPPRRNQVVWIDVEIPRQAAPGVYSGELLVRAAGHRVAGVRLELSVHPFEIPVRPSLAAWVPLYETRLWKREGLAALEPKARLEVLSAYWRMAHGHRFVTQVAEQQPTLRWEETTGALVSADWTEYDAVYGPVLDGSLFADREPPRLWKVGGFVWWGAEPGESPRFGGDRRRDRTLTPAHRRALAEYAREVERHFREKGWTRPELFAYMIDEPPLGESPGVGDLVRAYGDALHASGTSVKHMVTIAPRDLPALVGSVDIWATWGAGYRPREMRERQALGERAFFYQQHEPFLGGHGLDHDGLGLRSWAWIARRYGADGIFLWCGNFWNEDPYRNPRNWDDALLGNGVLFYPGALLPSLGFPVVRGPVASFRMKALRRGLFDYEYFRLLEAKGGDPGPMVQRVVRSALNEGEYDPYWKHPLWSKPGDWSHDPSDWDAARDEVAAEIVRRMGS